MANIVDDILLNPFGRRVFIDRVNIKIAGRPTPQLGEVVQATGKNNRGFSTAWYDRCSWLTGSAVKERLFCWSCVLFPTSGNANDVWQRNGFVDLKNLTRGVKRHSCSKDHIQAEVRLKLLGGQRIEHVLDEGARLQNELHNEKVKRNRQVLTRLIDITSLLSRQELAFRGHDETSDSANKGNYRELFESWSKYDDLLKSSLESRVFSGTSKSIQNDLIESVAHEIKAQIEKEISEAPFFSWEIDETTDITCKSQVSIIVRYTRNGNIVERFMGFFDVSAGRSAASLKELVDREMGKFNFKEKLVGQTYDGAAVMSSELNGLQSKVKEDAPQAVFVHCFAHQLNLVLSNGAKHIRRARVFFCSLSGFSSFFSKSTKRTHVLDSIATPRLPSNAPTRWNYTSRTVCAVAYTRDKLIEAFEIMRDSDDFDNDTIRGATGLLHLLDSFEFMFLLTVYKNIFDLTDILYDVLQSKSTDIEFCLRRIKNTTLKIKDMRCDDYFNGMYAEVLQIVPIEPRPRNGRRENICGDYRTNNRALFYEVLDNIIAQLELRFSDLDKLEFLNLVNVDSFENYTKQFPQQAFRQLVNVYGKYFNADRLKNELIVLYGDKELWSYPDPEYPEKSKPTLLKFFFANNLNEAMQEVAKLLELVATIAATSASTERSFSCLKRVKSYTRNTTGENRLSALSILSIEKELVKEMEKTATWYNNITDFFANMKNRRADFSYR